MNLVVVDVRYVEAGGSEYFLSKFEIQTPFRFWGNLIFSVASGLASRSVKRRLRTKRHSQSPIKQNKTNITKIFLDHDDRARIFRSRISSNRLG
jgi:hypothetical protein